MNKLAAVASSMLILPLTGCLDSETAKFSGLGKPHHVEMYSGGKKVRDWISTGKVKSESNSDGYYFLDRESGRLIEVSGDVVISMLKDDKEADEVAATFSK